MSYSSMRRVIDPASHSQTSSLRQFSSLPSFQLPKRPSVDARTTTLPRPSWHLTTQSSGSSVLRRFRCGTMSTMTLSSSRCASATRAFRPSGPPSDGSISIRLTGAKGEGERASGAQSSRLEPRFCTPSR